MTEQELEMMELRRVALRRSDAREDREERLNLEGALELCHQVNLPTCGANDLEALVVQVRTVLAEIHTASAHTLEALQETMRERDLLAAAVTTFSGLMRWFVDRCDKGEVRSVRTYEKYKSALHGCAAALALAAQIHSEENEDGKL